MIDFTLEHLFSYEATIGPPELIGAVPEGLRANFHVTGGTVTGSKVHGKVLPGGSDCLLMRPDGVAIVDVRLTMQTHDGAIIFATYHGLCDLGADGYQQFMAGHPPAAGSALRIFPRFQTAHEDYKWLQRLACIGIGEAHIDFGGESKLIFDIHAVK
ncbi:MAG: DUF3237 domain-containing protein [Planctomycetota bacterium]